MGGIREIYLFYSIVHLLPISTAPPLPAIHPLNTPEPVSVSSRVQDLRSLWNNSLSQILLRWSGNGFLPGISLSSLFLRLSIPGYIHPRRLFVARDH